MRTRRLWRPIIKPRYELRDRRNLFIKAEFFTPRCEGKEIRLIKSRWLFEPPEASSLVAPASGLTDFFVSGCYHLIVRDRSKLLSTVVSSISFPLRNSILNCFLIGAR